MLDANSCNTLSHSQVAYQVHFINFKRKATCEETASATFPFLPLQDYAAAPRSPSFAHSLLLLFYDAPRLLRASWIVISVSLSPSSLRFSPSSFFSSSSSSSFCFCSCFSFSFSFSSWHGPAPAQASRNLDWTVHVSNRS